LDGKETRRSRQLIAERFQYYTISYVRLELRYCPQNPQIPDETEFCLRNMRKLIMVV
jgi:hypothetical protein